MMNESNLKQCIQGAQLWADVAGIVRDHAGCDERAAQAVALAFLRNVGPNLARSRDERFQQWLRDTAASAHGGCQGGAR